jgi:lipopolysaccharide assembly outer membrane protein LptD (OstA)
MKRLSLTCAMTVWAAILSFGQTLRTGEVSVSAASQVVEGAVLHLKGNVQIRTNKIAIRADEADFNVNTSEVDALGEVRLTKLTPVSGTSRRALSELRGDTAHIRLDTGEISMRVGGN